MTLQEYLEQKKGKTLGKLQGEQPTQTESLNPYPEGTTFLRQGSKEEAAEAVDPSMFRPEGRRNAIREFAGEFGQDMLGYEMAGVTAAKLARMAGVAPHPAAKAALYLSGPLYALVKGTLQGQDPIETSKEMLADLAFLGGLNKVGLPAAKYAGRRLKGSATSMSDLAGVLAKEAVDAPLARPLQRMFPKTFHGETVRELFQPVIERAEPFLKGTLRRKELIGDLSRQAAAEMAERVKALSLEERYYVANFLKATRFDPSRGKNSDAFMKLPLDAKQRITNALSPYAEWERMVDKINPKHQALRKLEVMKQVQERFVKQMGQEGGVLDSTYFDELEPFLNGHGGVEQARNAFREVMAHPAVSDDGKRLAKDLYQLHHTVAETFPTAIQHAEETVLFSKLKSNPRWVSPAQRPGMVEATHPSFKGLWVTKDVDQAIKEYEYIPTFFARGFNKFFMTPWKMSKVVFRVPTHFRNIMSNVILNDLGGLPWYRADIYKQALRELKSSSKESKEFARLSGVGTTFSEVEIAPLLRSMEKHSDLLVASENYLSRLAGSMEQGALKGMEAFNKAYQMEEVWAKYSKYLWNVKQGMKKSEAAADAVKWTFNYGQVTPFVKSLRQTVSPFATWTTKVIPLMAEATAKNPMRVAKWALLPSALTQMSLATHGMTNKEWEKLRDNMPDYLSKGLVALMPTRDSEGRLQLVNFTWFLPGIGDIAQMYAGFGDPKATMQTLTQNPLLSIAGDLRHNRTMSGAPIYYEWEPPELKAQKLLAYGWMQLAPGVVSTDVQKLMRTFQHDPEAPTAAQFGYNQFGVPIIPLHPPTMARRKMQGKRAALGEMHQRMRREMIQAGGGAGREGVRQKYMKILQGVQEKWKEDQE